GNEYIPFRYESIDIEKNGQLFITDFNEKEKMVKYPNDPKLSDPSTWYDDINSYHFYTEVLKNDTEYSGLLDSSGKELLPPVYSKIDIYPDNIVVTDAKENKFVYCPGGKLLPLPEKSRLALTINADKNQFLLSKKNSFVMYNNGKEEVILTHHDTEYVSILSAVQNKVKNEIYIILGKNDDAAIYKIKGTSIKQVHPFARNSYRNESAYGISYLNEKDQHNFVTITGTEAVPYGNWENITDLSTFRSELGFMGINLIVVTTKSKTTAYNEKGKVLYSCTDCFIEMNECEWGNNDFNLYCGSFLPGKEHFLMYDLKTNKLTSPPLNNTSEQLNDTTWLLKDTAGVSYLYFTQQHQLKPLGIKHKSWFSFGEWTLSFSFVDQNDDWYFLDNKTLKLSKAPGKAISTEIFFSTYHLGEHHYFYSTVEDKGIYKKGIINETGKIIAKTEYESIEMPSDYEELALFACRKKGSVDLINLKGEIVNLPNQNFNSFYIDDESVLLAEIGSGDLATYEIFNAFNGYKRVNYSFKPSPIYPRTIKINNKYVIQFTKELTTKVRDGDEFFDDTNEYELYIGEDGTPFFELGPDFK
ncbi:MAG TPA: WG repeat-containing protein, partial [Bacteroidia bacterium]